MSAKSPARPSEGERPPALTSLRCACRGPPTMKASEARQIIAQSSRLVFFTGSGISSESGIATFRDSDGLWQKYDPDEFANAFGLIRNALLRPSRLAGFLHDF